MDEIIEELANHPEMLRNVTLAGPLLVTKQHSWPMWILQAGAPSFGRQHALGKPNTPIATIADAVHPVRVLAADALAAGDDNHWMRPRLVDLHLVVGAQNAHYRQRDSTAAPDDDPEHIDSDGLLLGWKRKGKAVEAKRGKALRSATEGRDESDGEAPFVHVVAEVLADGLPKADAQPAGAAEWFDGAKGKNGIPLPPLRLVAGRVGMHVNLTVKELKWLSKLGIVGAAGGDWHAWPKIWLVPDGIEFDAALPFPANTGAPLVGRVLLHAVPLGEAFELRLKLITPADPTRWAAAWSAVVPTTGNDGERLLGLKFVGRRGSRLPEFSWPVMRDNATDEPSGLPPGQVYVAGADCEIALVSPPVLGAIDSVAFLRPASVTVREAPPKDGAKVVQFIFSDGAGAQRDFALACACTPDGFILETDAATKLGLDFDLVRLSRELRDAYGVAAPPPVSSVRADGLPFGKQFGRPLIPAFVALENGWLQLPVPNLGPLDTSSDQVLAGTPPPAAARNVLSGFLRLRRTGVGEAVQSGFDPGAQRARDAESPWSVTIEQARGVSGTIDLLPAAAGATLQGAKVTLYDPVLSTRGMLWLSADRPDAEEALPRLGAGPGAFIDVAMQTPDAADAARPALSAVFSKLALSASRKDGVARATLAWDTMSVFFRTDSKRWVGELLKSDEARRSLGQSGLCIDAGFAVPSRRIDSRGKLLGLADRRVDAMRTQFAGAITDQDAARLPITDLLEVPLLKPSAVKASAQLDIARGSAATALAAAKKAQLALQEGHAALPSLVIDKQAPWSAVAWLRHPVIPLAAGMPMTRAAGGSQRPLESRDLHPYAVLAQGKPALLPLAVLARSPHPPLLELRAADVLKFDLAPVTCWPGAGAAPDRGIAYSFVAVPGAELRMLAPAAKGERRYQAACRFDLPLLDEAFATAALPPPLDAPARAAQEAVADSVPTALDWPLLAAFWREQERKQQNSRVVDSYLSGFVTTDAEQKVDVTTLVRGLTWSTRMRIDAFAGADKPPELPYGSLQLGGGAAVNGNLALAGYETWLTRKPGALLAPGAAGAAGAIHVLGFSPATFRDGDVDLDNAMSGAGKPVSSAKLLSRPITVNGGAPGQRLVSLLAPATATINASAFQFWFKDVLFDGDIAKLDADALAPIAFDALDDDALLAESGFEWRFAAAEPIAAAATLQLGRSEIAFFGFRLEPLRLLALSLANDDVASVTLLCRLTLRPRSDTGNLVKLTLSGAGLLPSFELANPKQPLRFVLRATDGDRTRRVVASASLVGSKQLASKNKQFELKGLSFEIDVADVMIDLGPPAFTMSELKAPSVVPIGAIAPWMVVIGAKPAQADAGRSRLRIRSADVSVQTPLDSKQPELPATLKWDRSIELFPQGEHADPAIAAVDWPLVAAQPLKLFGIATGGSVVQPEEANGALSDRLEASFAAVGGASARVTAAIVVRLAAPTRHDGTVDLAAGHCEGVVEQGKQAYAGSATGLCGAGITIRGARLRFSVTGNDSGEWLGEAAIDAAIDAHNDIEWPSLDALPAAYLVPLPKTKPRPLTGRVLVSAGQEPAAHHLVSWTLSGHRLPLTVAAAILRPRATAVWVTPAVARHTLERGDRKLSWTGVESIAIGRPAGLVPVVPPKLENDAITFAARYRDRIVDGTYKGPEPGMLRAGAGAAATVLQGALGADFRKLFWQALPAPADNVIIAGGFLGMLRLDGGAAAATLLRLPVLAGLGRALCQDHLGDKGIELAWSDGPAARAVALTRPTAPSPANASYDALAAAMLAGSLAPTAGAGDAAHLAGTLLVEQSFANPPAGVVPSLERTPFFLAAAVSVDAVLDAAPVRAKDGTATSVDSLSLVAGSLTRRGAIGQVALAAAVAMRDATPSISAAPARATLHVLGRSVRQNDWAGQRSTSLDSSLRPYLRALAATFDPDPVGFLLAIDNGKEQPVYLHGAIASLALDRGLSSSGDSSFCDGRRGLPAAPVKDDMLRWLAPPVEGPGTPIRDDKRSGLAGLTRTVSLPAGAGVASLWPAPDMVWLSQTQVPVYLPLQIVAMRGEPIGWLQSAPALVRLPVDADVAEAIRDSAQRDDAGTTAPAAAPVVQPFMPGQVGSASVGERAGIMTLRRIHMLARLDAPAAAGIGAYDAVNNRFGAPAQAGSSFARKLRTPRPGPLPANCGDPTRDRRIQASMVRPLAPGSAVIGSADIVQGGPGVFSKGAKFDEKTDVRFEAWAVEVIASPESASVVSERWDGSVRLVCRIEVRLNAAAKTPEPMPVTPADFLVTALGLAKGASSARLKIGAYLLDYRWLSPAADSEKVAWAHLAVDAPCENGQGWKTCSASIVLILDPREASVASQTPTPLADIARALAGSVALPAVEVQWSFIPGSARQQQSLPDKGAAIVLRLPGSEVRQLVKGGSERAPMTLRMPLYPVLQSRGSLPLTPSTLIFSDPAYDRDLANPPASSIKNLTASGGDERGALRLVLSADRGRINRGGAVTLMLDLSYERRMDELAQLAAEAGGAAPSGDLPADDTLGEVARLTLILIPKSGQAREVQFGSHTEIKAKPGAAELWIALGTVYEMPLSRVVEADGKPVELHAGDVLQVSAALRGKRPDPSQADSGKAATLPVRLWNTKRSDFDDVNIMLEQAPNCSLALTLTDEAVVEPPPALYLAMQRSVDRAGNWRIGVPLHAQSPLPRRVDLMDPARGFRIGLMRRHADFVWYLTCPATMLGTHSLAVHKSDRNGQGYWPLDAAEFLTPEDFSPLDPKPA
ncbi:MAG: hypothetical protein V4693_18180 [Pseudomonadota bacterium]